jgi:hypothetical protein
MTEPLRYPNLSTDTALRTLKVRLYNLRRDIFTQFGHGAGLWFPNKRGNSLAFRACTGILRDEWLRLKNAQKTN